MKTAKQRVFCKKRAIWKQLVATPWTTFPYTFVAPTCRLIAPGIPEKERA